MEQERQYISPNSGEVCRPPHYLAELSVTRKAKKEGKELPLKFWNMPEWKRDYRLAIMAAHSLLKIYDMEPILEALNSKDGQWIYSLKYNGLFALIEKAQKRLENEIKSQKAVPIETNPNNVKHVPKQQARKNTLNQLRD